MKASASYYIGLFLVALSTIMYEILLTRIFSVTTWYHFAFLAITLAMLGMTLGSIVVYLKPNTFTQEKTRYFSSLSALMFAVFSVAAIMVHIYCPYFFPPANLTLIIFGSLLAALPVLLVAFAFSGICVSLALTRFTEQVNTLYAADLIGAAIGCSGIVLMLQFFDGISASIAVAAIICAAAACFAGGQERKLQIVSAITGFAFAGLAVANASSPQPFLNIGWTKGVRELTVLYQKWNSFSRIRVMRNSDAPDKPYGHFSPVMPAKSVRQLWLDIDGCAQTTLTHFTGNIQDVDFLKYDISMMAHYLRPHSRVLVLGMGGGRDMLAALVMDQPSVTGVEINPNIIKAVSDVFGDFTGHLDKNPHVRIVNEEARSFVSHSSERFDIILASFVDTWAASASGAYSMTENSFYTIE
ncbi:MAG: hypothetical protein ACRD3W_13115, partial [Terriglobales bacterium]